MVLNIGITNSLDLASCWVEASDQRWALFVWLLVFINPNFHLLLCIYINFSTIQTFFYSNNLWFTKCFKWHKIAKLGFEHADLNNLDR